MAHGSQDLMDPGAGFWVDGTPAPKGVVKIARGRAYYYAAPNTRLRDWTKAVIGKAVLWDTGPGWRSDAPMEVLMDFHIARPPSHYLPNGNLRAPFANATPRGDLDKLIRGVLDALVEAKLMADDSQVVAIHASKRYGPRGGCGIRIRPLL